MAYEPEEPVKTGIPGWAWHQFGINSQPVGQRLTVGGSLIFLGEERYIRRFHTSDTDSAATYETDYSRRLSDRSWWTHKSQMVPLYRFNFS